MEETYARTGAVILHSRGNRAAILISDHHLDLNNAYVGILGDSGAPVCPLIFHGRNDIIAKAWLDVLVSAYDSSDDLAIHRKQLGALWISQATEQPTVVAHIICTTKHTKEGELEIYTGDRYFDYGESDSYRELLRDYNAVHADIARAAHANNWPWVEGR